MSLLFLRDIFPIDIVPANIMMFVLLTQKLLPFELQHNIIIVGTHIKILYCYIEYDKSLKFELFDTYVIIITGSLLRNI